jgi:hypothetical protein
MKAIGDLAGLRCSAFGAVSIETVPIAGDELYLRMISQPRLSACCGAVGQNIDHVSAFEIDDNRSVAVAFAPSPLVDSNHSKLGASVTPGNRSLEMSENGVPAGDHAKPTRQSLRRSPASGVAEKANDLRKALRLSCMRSRRARQPLDKDLLLAANVAATPSADLQVDEDGHTLNGKISDVTPVGAVPRM